MHIAVLEYVILYLYTRISYRLFGNIKYKTHRSEKRQGVDVRSFPPRGNDEIALKSCHVPRSSNSQIAFRTIFRRCVAASRSSFGSNAIELFAGATAKEISLWSVSGVRVNMPDGSWITWLRAIRRNDMCIYMCCWRRLLQSLTAILINAITVAKKYSPPICGYLQNKRSVHGRIAQNFA